MTKTKSTLIFATATLLAFVGVAVFCRHDGGLVPLSSQESEPKESGAASRWVLDDCESNARERDFLLRSLGLSYLASSLRPVPSAVSFGTVETGDSVSSKVSFTSRDCSKTSYKFVNLPGAITQKEESDGVLLTFAPAVGKRASLRRRSSLRSLPIKDRSDYS